MLSALGRDRLINWDVSGQGSQRGVSVGLVNTVRQPAVKHEIINLLTGISTAGLVVWRVMGEGLVSAVGVAYWETRPFYSSVQAVLCLLIGAVWPS